MSTMTDSERGREALENAIERLIEAGWHPDKIREEVEYILEYVAEQ